MGHVIFVILHIIAALFGYVLLIVTIPAHLIYSAVSAGKPRGHSKPMQYTHVRCPDCKELVLKEANICKHCRCKLTPQP